MNDFLQMNIFFFITTLAVIVFTIFGALIMWRVYKILGSIEHVGSRIADESDAIAEDIKELRSDIKAGKSKVKSFLKYFGIKI